MAVLTLSGWEEHPKLGERSSGSEHFWRRKCLVSSEEGKSWWHMVCHPPCRRFPAEAVMEPSCSASQQSVPGSMDAEGGSGDIKAEERDGGGASVVTEQGR